MPGEEFLEGFQAHHGDLFTMIGVRARPDVNKAGPGFWDLCEDLVQSGSSIHGGRDEVVQLERSGLSSGGERAGKGSSCGRLAE